MESLARLASPADRVREASLDQQDPVDLPVLQGPLAHLARGEKLAQEAKVALAEKQDHLGPLEHQDEMVVL